jgi:hypothetical protein
MVVTFVDYVNRYAAPRIHGENLSHYYRAVFLKLLVKIPGCRKEWAKKDEKVKK